MLSPKISSAFHGHGIPEPIGLEYVAGSLALAGYSCHFRDNNELIVSLENRSASLCLLSALSCEFPRVVDAAHRAKARGETTILGGYHACGIPKDGDLGPFDYIVTGEGEDAAVAIAQTALNGERGELDPFLVGRQNGTKVLNAPKIRDLDSMPFPLRSKDRLGRYLLYDLIWPPASLQHNTAIVLSSRVCLHNCDFCASATVWGQEAVYRSKEN